MAQALECDACGKLYKRYNIKAPYHTYRGQSDTPMMLLVEPHRNGGKEVWQRLAEAE